MQKRFKNIEGQERVVSVLNSQLESGKFSHAYLFLGNDGVGKEYLAKQFGRYILCPEKKDDDCPSCHRFKLGAHPDFIYINGDEGIKIETVREAIERINLSPNMGKYKVILFSGAENLGHEAANALLKTLEEPPLDSVILLTAISEKSLPQTVVSRAQKIKLKNLELKEIKKILTKDYSEEEVEKALLMVSENLGEAKRFLSDTEYAKTVEAMKGDLKEFESSKSIIEKFKIIEKYDKEKNLKIFFDLYASEFFKTLEGAIKKGEGENRINILSERARKVLKIYSNLNYNVNLRASFESVVIGSIKDE